MRQLKQRLIAATCACLMLIISACGWHLRGSEPIPEELKTLYLGMANENSDLSRSLKRSLKTMGIALVEKASDAPLTLTVSDLRQNRRTVSTSGRGKAAEYELTSQLTYQILDSDGDILHGPDTVSAEKIYLFDPNNVVSAYEEEQILREEMQRDLVSQLIRRYQAVRVSVPAEQPDAAQ